MRGAAALLGAVALVAVSMTTVSAANCSYVFSKTLKKGSTGAEVMNLQKVLNMNAATTIAASGSGSAGNETMTFGSATHAAVVKFQAANGVTPTSGLVGPLTRNKLNAMCTGTGTTTTGTTTTATGPVSVANGASVNSTLIAGQTGAILGNFTFSGNGTVSNVELMRTGVSNNSTLTNVYLYDGATRLTDAASVSSDGTIRFNNVNLAVAGSKSVSVRADIAGGTSGQTVGVMFSKMTPVGGSQATVSGVMANNQTIATISGGAAINTIAVVGTGTSVDAGIVSKKVWENSFQVSGRSVNFKGITFKYVGSAPTDALTNIALYVDAVKVGSGSINGDKVVFDMASAPKSLQVGSHSIDLRADIVKGATRTFEFRVENSADVMFEDSQLSGVNVSANLVNFLNPWTIGGGKVTLNQEPSFTDSKLTIGKNAATLGKWKINAYGEDVKIETVTITAAANTLGVTTAGTGAALSNATLYVNGSAVGSTQTLTGTTATTFTLGSSLIVPAGQTAVLEFRADLRTLAGVAYDAGGITLNAQVTQARGQSSQNAVSPLPGASASKSLSMSTGVVTVAKTGGFTAQTVSPNSTTAIKIGSFTVQAADTEDLRVTGMDVLLAFAGGTPVIAATDFSNLTITSGQQTIAIPGTTNTFSMDVVIPKGSSKTFEVMSNIGSAPSGGAVTTNVKAYYQGVSSLTTGNQTTTTGVAMTVNNAAIAAADITKLSSSPVSQLVIGGATNSNIVSYNIKTTGGIGSATVTDMKFTVAPTSDAIIKVTVGTKSVTVVGTTATISGLDLAIPTGSAGLDIPVTVDYGTISSTGTNSQASALSTVDLTEIKYNSGSASALTVGPLTGKISNAMQLVASKPTLAVSGSQSGLLIGTENKVGQVTVSADAAGNVKVKAIKFITSGSFTPTLSAVRLADGSTTISDATCTAAGLCTFAVGYTITAGSSKTFSLFANVAGTVNTSGTVSVSSKVDAAAFLWDDVNGGGTNLTGANIKDFPTTAFTITQ
jgi:Putative peptidoglycan binding domain